jgi:hypothetical protein
MPYLTLQNSPGGPIVDLLVNISAARAQALKSANQAAPQGIQIRALLDTGASGTCIDPAVLTSLGLTPKGQVPVHTPSTGATPHLANQYDVGLTLLHPKLNFIFQTVPVIESNLSQQGIQGLIGRDLLAHCLFVYDGASGTFCLGF